VALGVAVLLWVVLVAAPPWFVPDRTPERSLPALELQNQVRTTLLQGLAGAFLFLGAYFTYRQLMAAREGQITERYTRAIDQLGNLRIDVRIGGIYALERIARDSPADRRTIGEVLTAYVRGHSPWPPSLPDQPAVDAPLEEMPALQARACDVQASLTVLGRGGFHRYGTLSLAETDLRKADLHEAHLEGANLMAAHLEGAFLVDAHLERAILLDTHLEGADLLDARFDRAFKWFVHLEGATNLPGGDPPEMADSDFDDNRFLKGED
jgi:hypothetical protein